MTEKLVAYSQVLANKEDDSENILIKLEKLFVVLPRKEIHSEYYSSIDDQFKVYLNKISGPTKEVCLNLIDRNAILVGINSKKTINILGAASISESNKIICVILESSAFDIDVVDSSIGNIEEAVVQCYYQFIRLIDKSFPEISKNFEIHEIIIQIYTYLLLKTLRIPVMVEKKVDLLKYCVAGLYYRHFLNMHPSLASEKALLLIAPASRKEVSSYVSEAYFSKYSNIKDILKIVIDLKIIFDTPNNLIYQMLNQLKVVSFLSITSNFGHLLAALLSSLHSVEFYKPLLVNRQLQEKLETLIIPYFNKVSYEKLTKFTYISDIKRVQSD